jgi:glutathione S-transferase
MQLYVDSQFASPYAMSVFVCLHEKGLPFDVETVDLSAGSGCARQFSFGSQDCGHLFESSVTLYR